MDIGAGIAGFIGLSGTILQGCNYLANFFDDAKEAPHTVLAISRELNVLQSTLETFLDTLQYIQAGSFNTKIPDPKPALKICEDAIAKLRQFIDKYADLTTQVTSSVQGTSPVATKTSQIKGTVLQGWQRVNIAWLDPKLQKHVTRLERAKTSLQAVQGNIQLIQGQHHSTVSLEIRNILEMQRIEHANSAQSLDEVRLGTADVRSQQQGLVSTSTQILAELGKMGTDSKSMSTQFARVAEHSIESRDSALATNHAVNDFGRQLSDLPTIMKATVETALAKHRADSAETIKEVMRDLLNNRYDSTLEPKPSYENERQSHVQFNELDSADPDCCVSRYDAKRPISRRRNQTGEMSLSLSPSVRGRKRQVRSTSTYKTWLGTIQVTTAETLEDDDGALDDPTLKPLRAKWTDVLFIPNLWFWRTGIYLRLGNSKPSISHPALDNPLHVFYVHESTSPIARAIETGNYRDFRTLLEARKATPFDFVSYGFLEISLFDFVIEKYLFSGNWQHRNKWLKMAELLANAGVDCGAGMALNQMLTRFDTSLFACEEILCIFRIIMRNSKSDPFNIMDTDRLDFAFFYNARVIFQQDEWDVTKLREIGEDTTGRGIWEFVNDNGKHIGEWHDKQDAEWKAESIDFRHSKEWCRAKYGTHFVESRWPRLSWNERRLSFWRDRNACLSFYGECFVECEWPKLYWNEERPVLWRCREACLDFFGEYFVECEWPKLYWNEERPVFWRCREACLDFFGEYFVKCDWPEMYWKEERLVFWRSLEICKKCFDMDFGRYSGLLGRELFESVEGRGSWEAKYRKEWYYSAYREDWISKMVESWRLEGSSFRHDRRHCLKQYGSEFVEKEWPQLLREDGLKEEELLRLVEVDLDTGVTIKGLFGDSDDDEAFEDDDDDDDESDRYGYMPPALYNHNKNRQQPSQLALPSVPGAFPLE